MNLCEYAKLTLFKTLAYSRDVKEKDTESNVQNNVQSNVQMTIQLTFL